MGRYRIVGELGRGGMGVVYRAEDERLGRSVALKFLPTHLRADADANERLMVEARAAAALDHPNVCTVYEVAETEDGRAYIAFACYDGQTLAERLETGPLAVDEAVRIARGVAAGLAAAHERGVVHRDLKPSNVFLTEDGTAKVLDFGIARVRGVALTAPGATPGTVEYGAPETTRGHADERSDVWSLGVVLHEMLTGRRPFHAPYPAAVLYAVLHEDPPPPSALNPAVPPEVDAVVARCLAKDPDGRYPDAAALAAALVPAEARSPDDLPAVVRRAGRALGRRLRPLRAWQAVAAAALALGVAFALGVFRPAEPPVGLPEAMVLAILPPTPSPSTPDESAFASGLADDLTSGLARYARGTLDLSVIPYTDVRSEGVETARQARAELGANVVVEGSLRREGGRVRLVLTLVRPGARRSRVVTSAEIALGRAGGGGLRARALQALLTMLGATPPASLDTAETADPDAWELYVKGLGYLRRDQEARDVDRAITLFGLAIDEDSTFASAHARLGEAHLEKWADTRDPSWIRRAEAATERAVSLDPASPLPHIARSRLFVVKGEYPRALQEAREAVALDPSGYDALLALGDAEDASGDGAGAEAAYRGAVDLHPRRWTAHTRLGYLFFARGELDSAAAQFHRVLAVAPGNFQSLYSLGAIAQQDGDAPAARSYYERAARVRDHYGTYTNLALIAADEGRPGDAVALLRRALALDSTDHRTWNSLASAYSDLPSAGAQRPSRVALERAVALAEAQRAENPQDPTVLAFLASYYALLGDPAPAREAAALAARLAPDAVEVQFRVGFAYAVLGDTEAALPQVLVALDAGHETDTVRESPDFADLRRNREVAARLSPTPR